MRLDHRWRLLLVDLFRGTDALRLFDHYLSTQWLPHQVILERQWRSLVQLLEHAYSNVPYYRRVFESLHIRPSDVRSLADFRKLPLLTKDIIRANSHELLATNSAQFQPHRKLTGGSTGNTLAFSIDRRSRSAQWAAMYRQWSIGGWKPGDKLVYLGGSSIYPSLQALKKWLYVRLNNWLLYSSFEISDVRMERWLRQIQRSNVRFMHAYASSAYLLAKYLEDHCLTDIRLQAVFTSAEPLHSIQRESIQRVFSCPVFDFYGANDGGGFAFECDQHDGLHCVAERAFIEILADDGRAAAEGESGDVVSTDLLNYAMPFVRYKVEDIATTDGRQCKCGRGLPLLKDIKGRSHEFLTTMKGERVHGEFFGHLLREKSWVNQFHVVQESKTNLKVFLHATRAVSSDQVQSLKNQVRRKFQGMDVEVILCNDVPTAPSGKFRYIINKTLDYRGTA